jgi:hypothetical protein
MSVHMLCTLPHYYPAFVLPRDGKVGGGRVSEVYKLGWLTQLYSMYSLLALPFSFCTSLIPDINLPTSIIYLITP